MATATKVSIYLIEIYDIKNLNATLVTRIICIMPTNGSIDRPNTNLVMVAVDKDKNSGYAFRWTTNNIDNPIIIAVHVKPKDIPHRRYLLIFIQYIFHDQLYVTFNYIHHVINFLDLILF